MGQEGAWTADVTFDGVRVPADALVGGSEEVGYRAAMMSLARGRVHIAGLAVGSARRALDESIAYAADATQGGTPIGDFQLVQAMLADMQTGVSSGEALVRDAARKYHTGQDRRIAPSVAKLHCTEMAGRVADLAVQVHGGTGYMREVPVDFAVVYDPKGAIAARYDLEGMPSSYVYSRDGELVARHLGFQNARRPEYEALLSRLLQ